MRKIDHLKRIQINVAQINPPFKASLISSDALKGLQLCKLLKDDKDFIRFGGKKFAIDKVSKGEKFSSETFGSNDRDAMAKCIETDAGNIGKTNEKKLPCNPTINSWKS